MQTSHTNQMKAKAKANKRQAPTELIENSLPAADGTQLDCNCQTENENSKKLAAGRQKTGRGIPPSISIWIYIYVYWGK